MSGADTIRLGSVYVPTLRQPGGPLVVMTSARPVTALQLVVRPCRRAAETVVRTALECRRVAIQVTAILVTKLASLAKSLVKFVKRDFLKKEGVPLKGMVIYKGGAKGMGKILKNAM